MEPWTIPSAGLQVYRHRDQIAGTSARVAKRLRGEKRIVAVTGMPGVGKTVLLDHLTDKADENYRLPAKSEDIEQGTRRGQKLRLLFRVIPGQHSPIRVQGMDQLFNAKKPIAGVVHVVANGYASVRSNYARQGFEEDMTLVAYRRQMLKAEVDDLRSTLAHVRGVVHRHKDPFWILVAVNKADLFSSPELLREAYQHYALDSPFVDALKDFTQQVGADNVQWEARPVCAWPETFVWRGKAVRPSLDRGQQLQLLYDFAQAIERRSVAGRR